MTEPRITPPEIRFWRHVNKLSKDECWLWKGGTTGHGYGRFRPGPRGVPMIGAHVFSWQIENGYSVPKGLFVLHSCDNPRCVNPAHLRVGTPRENTLDATRKGRMKHFFRPGPNHRRGKGSKLNEFQVAEIKRDKRDPRTVAARYGVSRQLIGDIRSGRAWKHV